MPHRTKLTAAAVKLFLPHLLLLLAFGLQAGYLVELQHRFPGAFLSRPFCGVDAVAHLERAGGLLDGSVPGEYPFAFLPLYPIFLATLKILLGDSLYLPVFLQVMLQLVGLAALYRLGRFLFSPLAGLLALAGLATYNYFIFYIPCFDQALLTTPALTLFLFFLVAYYRRRRQGYLLGAGVAFAVAVLSRPTLFTLLPVVGLWLFWRQPSLRRSGWVLLLGLPVVIALAPITWHNYRVTGKFIPIADNFGVNLFTGNNPDAYGLDSLAHDPTQPAVMRFIETVHQVEQEQTTFEAEVLRYFREQPEDALALTLRKTWLWFGEADKPLVEPFFPLLLTQTTTLARLPLQWQGLVVAGLLGLLLARSRSRADIWLLGAVYLVFSLTTILFFIQLRFRLPFIPFVILLAAALLASAPGWRGRRPGRFWGVLAVFLLLSPFVPGLPLLALLFAGLGLWSPGGRRWPAWEKWLVTGAAGYLLVVVVWLRATALAADVSQTINFYLGPPLAGAGILGQSFQMDCDGLHQIEVTLGLLNDRHDQPVTFYLATDLSGRKILFSETFEGPSVKDYQTRKFTFAPLAGSAGRTYFFFFASPTSTPDNAITARGYLNTPVDYYPAGSAYAGQLGTLQPLQADFAFSASCSLNPWQKLRLLFD